ncbi:MAG: M15 family metallopeptidase [Bacteroidota bacterium]
MKKIICLSLLVPLCFFNCQQKSDPQKEAPKPSPIQLEKVAPIFDYDTTAWTDIGLVDTTILLDIKYATTDNFVKEKMYDCGRCWLRPEVAERVMKAQRQLQAKGLGLKIFDCYRPKPVQEKLWAKVPNANYVTPPSKGSMHNRGAAVDLTIVDENGVDLDMGTAYDYFGQEAHHTYTQHSKEVASNRALLKSLMESLELRPIRTEWWHYSYRGKTYEISEALWNCPSEE